MPALDLTSQCGLPLSNSLYNEIFICQPIPAIIIVKINSMPALSDRVCLHWSANEYDEYTAYYLGYNGSLHRQDKDWGNPRHGYRCVKAP